VIALARQLRRERPKGGQRSLREIAAELEKAGHLNERGARYSAASVQHMLAARAQYELSAGPTWKHRAAGRGIRSSSSVLFNASTQRPAMANKEHVAKLKEGVTAWNAWRKENPDIQPDLSGANLSDARLWGAVLKDANLSGADLRGAAFNGGDLSKTNLRGADLRGAHLRDANLSWADLRGADLEAATLVDVDLTGADLTGSRIYGVSAWNLKLVGAKQQNLLITHKDQPDITDITVDDIEVAQFINLLLHNEKLQRVIDTITTKMVMILGRFSLPERKRVLDALRDELRSRNYVSVVFDFEKPRSQTTINTVMLLARMARFVIADISDAKSVLQELQAIVPSSPKLPVQPIIVAAQEEPGMFDSFQAYPWFLKVHPYDALAQLLAHLDERVIGPAETKAAELRA
jgi:Pentapeptide repeats (8 copies)